MSGLGLPVTSAFKTLLFNVSRVTNEVIPTTCTQKEVRPLRSEGTYYLSFQFSWRLPNSMVTSADSYMEGNPFVSFPLGIITS